MLIRYTYSLYDYFVVSLPEITPELAEQIVNQVALQHESNASTNETVLSQDDVQVIEVSNDQTCTTDEQGLGRLITQVIMIKKVMYSDFILLSKAWRYIYFSLSPYNNLRSDFH